MAWSPKNHNFSKIHTFGCLVQYLKVGHDKGKQSEKYASKTSFGIFLGMPSNQASYLIFDPLRPDVIVRDDVKFFDDTPGYPRLMSKATQEVSTSAETNYFSLFPDDEEPAPDAPPATPVILVAAVPPVASVPPPAAVPPPVTPIDVIQLSTDAESGADGDDDNEREVDWVTTQGESIADRVAAKRRAHLASFGDIL